MERLLKRLLQRLLTIGLGVVSIWLIVFVVFRFADHRTNATIMRHELAGPNRSAATTRSLRRLTGVVAACRLAQD